MKTYYTYFDKNYLIQGLAMANSLLEKSTQPYTLHILCLDESTFIALDKLKIKNVILYSLQNLERQNQLLKEIKNKFKPEASNTNLLHYLYAFSCWFTIYMLNTVKCEEIVYIDADIYFFDDPTLIYSEMEDNKNKSVGIIKHRHVGNFNCPFGFYNVGVLYFRNNEMGKNVANWWLDSYINQKYPQWSTCGDQKYLEGFEVIFGKENIHVIDNIGHGAPWNLRFYQYDFFEENKIMWGKEIQPFVFMHFSKFFPDYNKETFSPSDHHYSFETLNFEVYKLDQVKKIYKTYFNVCLQIYKHLKKIGII